MTTEELKHEMYEQLAVIRKARKHPIMLQNFEDDLEAYLEALRQEHGDRLVNLDHSNRMVEVYSEAYNSQKTRTHNALCESRRLSDDLWETRRELASVQNDREEGHDKLQEATAKLAQGTESIKALHRVIKTQQIEQDRLQRGLDEALEICARDRARYAADLEQWGTNYDEQWDANQEKQKLIVSQRKAIETLHARLYSLENNPNKRGFWRVLLRKNNKAKPIPKKTN